MDNNSEIIANFEKLLKEQRTRNHKNLYSDDKNKVSSDLQPKKSYDPREILAKVSTRIRDIQKADCYRRNNSVRKPIEKGRKSSFLPVDMLVKNDEPKQSKFETQCISDTQLIDIIQCAEALETGTGVTQEFETTFHHEDEDVEDETNQVNTPKDTPFPIIDISLKEPDPNKVIQSEDSDSDDQLPANIIRMSQTSENGDDCILRDEDIPNHPDTSTQTSKNVLDDDVDDVEKPTDSNHVPNDQNVIDICTQSLNKLEIENDELDDLVQDKEKPASPILGAKSKKSHSPLVFNLELFETFEKIAISAIKESPDLETAKELINSQIIGKELLIHSERKPKLSESRKTMPSVEKTLRNSDRVSPVIPLNPEELKMEKDMFPVSKPKDHSNDLFEDEILFSSDEETYVCNNIQDLPFTCALETSFYDEPEVLDKTMYVGFQTASNKSIQIDSDSFSKAKSIFSDIEKDVTLPPLKTLVSLCDNVLKKEEENGKDVSIDKEVITSDNKEDKISIDLEEDTSDIIQSQIIPFVSQPKHNKSKRLSQNRENKKIENMVDAKSTLDFKTANGKSIGISNEALTKCKSIFRDIDIDQELPDNDLKSKTNDSKDISTDDTSYVTSKRRGDTENAITDTIAQYFDDTLKVIHPVEDFKAIKGSDKDPKWTEVRKVDIEMRDCQQREEFKIEKSIIEVHQNERNHPDFDSNKISDEMLPLKSSSVCSDVNVKFLGFKTASNKDIQISDIAISKSKEILNDLVTLEVNTDCGSNKHVELTSRNKELSLLELHNDSHKKDMPKENLTGNEAVKEQFDNEVTMLFDDVKEQTNEELLRGFETDNGNDIISNAVSKTETRQIFNHKDNEVYLSSDKSTNNNEGDFNHDQILKKATIQNFEEDIFEECIEKLFRGFETNKKITNDLSPETKQIFRNIDNKVCHSSDKSTNNNEGDFNHDLILNKTTIQNFEEDIFEECTSPGTDEEPFYGFESVDNEEVKQFEEFLSNYNIIEELEKESKCFENNDLSKNINNGENINDTCDVIIMNKEVTKEVQQSEAKQTTSPDFKFLGFKTATNKPVTISDDALLKSKKIFQGVDIPSQDPATKDIPSTSNFQGFKTASNKTINTSADALAKSKKIFEDLNVIQGDNHLEIFKHNFTSASKFQDSKTSSNDSDNTSAKNKHIFQGNYSVGKEKRLASSEEITTVTPKFKGFQTASNKHIAISDAAMAKTKTIFENIDNFDHAKYPKTEPSSKFKGFQTASNKPVKISAEALAKTRNILKDIDDFKEIETPPNSNAENTYSITKFQGFQTASNKNVKISKQALAKSKKIFEDFSIHSDKIEAPVPGFQGFQTASNKPVKISAEALAKTRNIFQGIDDFKETETPQNNIEEKSSLMPKFQGFQTASNKNVKVSEQALTKSRKIFQDLASTEDLERNVTLTGFQGFQTASNKPVKISAEGLAKTKNIFENIDDFKETETLQNINEENTYSIPKFQGFQTASNKNVKVSEQALAKSRKIFQDLESTEDLERNKTTTGFRGFQTASNKKVIISETALAKSRQIFKDIDENQLNEEDSGKQVIQEFKMAKEKGTKISENVSTERKTCENGHDDRNEVIDNPEKKIIGTFTGFQTANNKHVKISDQALEQSRAVFKDFNVIENENIDGEKNISLEMNGKVAIGFKTANNKNIKISEDALMKTKQLFADLANTSVKESSCNTTDIDLNTILNTQVLKIFDESLHTEDFLKDTMTTPQKSERSGSPIFLKNPMTTPRASKRSGSPILSCPKAKKRKKFEIPYSQKVKNPIEEDIIKDTKKNLVPTTNIAIEFDKSYKKSEKYSLKDLENFESKDTDQNPETDEYLTNFDFDSLLQFEFSGKRNEISSTKLSIKEIKSIFLENVNKKLIPDGWLDNHIKLILWKLISYEIKFPKTMSGVASAKNVLQQLKYRYDKELYNAERSALRKIMEKDDTSTKTLVLCIIAILADGKKVTSIPTNATTIELVVSDGWYNMRAIIDACLRRWLSGKVVGCKIITSGAIRIGDHAAAPWEDTSSISLKLSGNSTRIARWDTRLGYHSTTMLVPLRSVSPDGGATPKLRLYLTRVYPALYVERFQDGSTVTRSERLEHLHLVKYESDRQALLEKLYEDVEKEICDQESQDSDTPETGVKRKCLDSGSQIAKIMKRNKDPEFRNHLTTSQTILLENHQSKERERLLQEIQSRVQDKLATLGLEDRNVVNLIKVRVIGIECRNDKVEVTKAMLSIWKPNDAVLEIIKEGAWIEVINVVPTAVRYSELQLSAGRQTVFMQSKYKESEKMKPYLTTLKRTCYPIKDLAKNPSMTTEYNEIDTVGLIFLIDPSIREFDSNKHQFQNVYLADGVKNIICINFWGGLKKFGFENILDTGQIVSCTNLQKRAGNTRKNIQQFRVTEFSYFTKTPKNENARKICEELTKIFTRINMNKYIEDCVNLKNNYTVMKPNCNENISPYRVPNININTIRNKVFIDSPLAQKNNKIDDLNLTGLDFESTFKQTDSQELSPKTLLRKQQIKEKIAKLKMYGEPPPLSPMQILNRSKYAGSAFKSPMSKSDTPSVANDKKFLPILQNNTDSLKSIAKDDVQIQCSPVINKTNIKRTYINPVKLNFSNNVDENKSEVRNDFAEEFESSPPLSLD